MPKGILKGLYDLGHPHCAQIWEEKTNEVIPVPNTDDVVYPDLDLLNMDA